MPKLSEEIDSYQDTVWALLGFHHELTWDDDNKKVLLKRDFKARHTATVTLKSGQIITPDIHLVVPGGLSVGDIKISFTQSDNGKKLADIEDQLRKYDAALVEIGESEDVPAEERCLVLLVHNSRVKAAQKFVQDIADFEHKIGVIGYYRTDQANSYIALDLREGEITPASKQAKFDLNPLQIGLQHLEERFPDFRFYDADAPDLYVAEIFWTTVLYDKAAELADPVSSALPKEVAFNAADVANDLATFYGIRRLCKDAKQCPSTKQMRRVFDLLVKIGLAKHVEGDEYIVYRRELREIRPAFEARLAKAEKLEKERARKAAEREAKRIEKAKAKEAEKAAKKAERERVAAEKKAQREKEKAERKAQREKERAEKKAAKEAAKLAAKRARDGDQPALPGMEAEDEAAKTGE